MAHSRSSDMYASPSYMSLTQLSLVSLLVTRHCTLSVLWLRFSLGTACLAFSPAPFAGFGLATFPTLLGLTPLAAPPTLGVLAPLPAAADDAPAAPPRMRLTS